MSKGKTILIIDDDPDFASAIRKILMAAGYEVRTAGDAKEGMTALETALPDLILLDVMMEHYDDGFNLCSSIKHDDRFKEIPVIIVTAVTEVTGLKFDPETDGEYLEAEALFQKPITPDDLLKKIEELL
ncbi:MAG: response regulator [Deltaproteobacteria bacterium]|nr:response regulator [Deltaproteobacteria bacterium]